MFKYLVYAICFIIPFVGFLGTVGVYFEKSNYVSCKLKSKNYCDEDCECVWCEPLSVCLDKIHSDGCSQQNFIDKNCEINKSLLTFFVLLFLFGIVINLLFFFVYKNYVNNQIKYDDIFRL